MDKLTEIIRRLHAGKVDAYRFMTFYLEPGRGNFEDLFEKAEAIEPRSDDGWVTWNVLDQVLGDFWPRSA